MSWIWKWPSVKFVKSCYRYYITHNENDSITYKSTLYKLYAVPVRVCSTREDMQYPWVISSVPVSHILSTHEDMQYLWAILDSFQQASEIKSPKLVTKYQNDSKAEFTGSPSETESDSDSTEGTESEDKVSASSVIYSNKNH